MTQHSFIDFEPGDTVEILGDSSNPMYEGEVGVVFRKEGHAYYVQMDDGNLIYMYGHEMSLINRGKGRFSYGDFVITDGDISTNITHGVYTPPKRKKNVNQVEAFRIRALCYEDQLQNRKLCEPLVMTQLKALVKKARLLKSKGYNSKYIRKYADKGWDMIIGDV